MDIKVYAKKATKDVAPVKDNKLEFVNVIIPNHAVLASSEKSYFIYLAEDEGFWIPKKYVNRVLDTNLTHLSLGIVEDWDYTHIDDGDEEKVSGKTIIYHLLITFKKYNHTLYNERE